MLRFLLFCCCFVVVGEGKISHKRGVNLAEGGGGDLVDSETFSLPPLCRPLKAESLADAR